MTSSLFEGYQHEGFFDEFVDELGEVRPHYRQLALRLGALAPEELARRERLRDAAFRCGHHVHGLRRGRGHRAHVPDGPAARASSRPTSGHTSRQASVQRVTALNRFLDDLYVGERAAVQRRHRAEVARDVQSDGFEREAFGDPGARGRSLPRRRHRPRARRRRHLPRARGQPAQPERHLLRAREPRRDDPGAADACSATSGPPGRPLRRVAARRPAPRRARGGGRRPDRRGAHARRLQLRVLRARVPRSPDGRRARRGPRPRRRRARRLDAHDAGPAARRRHLPPHRRRLPRPVPFRRDSTLGVPGLMARRPRPATSRSRTPSATASPTTRPSTRTCPTSSATTWARSRSSPTSRPTCCGTTTSAPRCSTGSTSSS